LEFPFGAHPRDLDTRPHGVVMVVTPSQKNLEINNPRLEIMGDVRNFNSIHIRAH
jgi:hypothetical protein